MRPMLHYRAVRVTALGHVSLFVRDLEASLRFYRDLLGLRDGGRAKEGRIAFLTAGIQHHDLSLEVARVDGPAPRKGAPGLYHIAFCLGRDLRALEAARREVEAAGLAPYGEMGGATPCFCIRDPDGNEVELYVEDAGASPGFRPP